MDKDMLAALVRVVILLPLICGLAYLSIRFGFGRTKIPLAHGSQKRMRLVEQVSLGPKCGLSLVQVGTRYMLFAHQEGNIILVREMEELPAAIESAAPQWPGLVQLVSKARPSGIKADK